MDYNAHSTHSEVAFTYQIQRQDPKGAKKIIRNLGVLAVKNPFQEGKDLHISSTNNTNEVEAEVEFARRMMKDTAGRFIKSRH